MEPIAPQPAPDLSVLRDELCNLHTCIPMFATWRMPELERIVLRYGHILETVARVDSYDYPCAPLIDSLPDIHDDLRLAIETGHWKYFNKAAIAVEWDMGVLINILGRD